jgi:hypothetical protein
MHFFVATPASIDSGVGIILPAAGGVVYAFSASKSA